MKMLYPKINTLLLFWLLTTLTIAQPKSIDLKKLTTNESTKDWLTFKSDARLNKQMLLDNILDKKQGNALNLKKQKTDPLGFTHYRYQQTYKGIPVEHAIFLVHEKAGFVEKANGKLIEGLQLSTQANLNEQEALKYALTHINAQKYAWQDENYEKTLQEVKGNTSISFAPKGKLVIVSPKLTSRLASDYRLAYHFNIFAIEPLKRVDIYVDAQNGDIIAEYNNIHDTDAACTGHNAYGCNSTVNITGDYTGNFYRLRAADRGNGVETYDSQNSQSYPPFDMVSTDNLFDEDPVAVAAHWGTEQTYDYYLTKHNRNSFDGNGAKLKSWVHFRSNYNNAFWNGNWMAYGDGDGSLFTPLTSIDIVGHEITHGVTEYTADLVYAYESGALNESFSDIFGTAIEFFADPACADWFVGEDVTPDYTEGLRNMANPNSNQALRQQPDTYLGHYWNTEGKNNNITHINSGVQNYWFYLLSEGGSGVNDNEDSYSVSEIGIDKAAAIAYRNLSIYLTPISEYVDARSGSIQAAIDLYGAGSNEVNQVLNAWCAVGVGPKNCVVSNNTLTLTSPNGSETWQQGSTQNISWTSSGNVNSVQLEYSLNNGATWMIISSNIANEGSYIWTVPNIVSNIVLIRVTDTQDATTKDESDEVLHIQGCNVLSSFLPSDVNICEGESITFTNNSSNATAYEWQIDALNQTTSTDFTHTFTSAGTYIVSLIASNGSNCSATHSEVITVNPQSTANFTYTDHNDLSVDFFADFVGATSYAWTIDGSGTASMASFTHTFPSENTYNICLTVADVCGNDSYCENITVVNENNNCINGETWRQYLNRDDINTLLEVGDDIFVGTNGGLLKINKISGATTFFTTFNSDLPHSSIYSLLEATDGSIYVGTYNSLAKFDGISTTGWTVFSMSNSSFVDNLLEGSDGSIYVGTFYGLAKFDGINPTGWTVFNTTNSDLPNNDIRALLEGSDGSIYVGTYNGIAKFDGVSATGWTVFNTINSDLLNDDVRYLLESDDGNIYVGTWGGGLAKFDGINPTGWTTFYTANSDLPNNDIKALLESSDGSIYVGTSIGLSKFDGINPTGWTNFYTFNSDLPSNYIGTLLEGSDGSIYVGTSNGLAKFDGINPAGWTIFNTTNTDLPNNSIKVLLESSDSSIYVGTSNGLSKFDGVSPTGWTIFNTTNSDLTYNSIGSLLEGNDGNIYVGTLGGGLAIFNGISPAGWTIFDEANSDLPHNSIFSLLEGSDGSIYVGTSNGLSKFDGVNPTGWTIFNSGNSDLPNGKVETLLEGSDGSIYVGTWGGGLAKFDGVSTTGWTTFHTANSDLPSEFIEVLLKGSDGSIYVGTSSHGLAKFDGTSTIGWTIYNTNNSGLPNNDVGSIIETSNNEIFVGTLGGLGVLSTTSNSNNLSTSFTYPSARCAGTSITFTNTTTNTTQSTTYEWQINGTSIATTTNLTHTFPQAGDYMVTLIAADGSCSDFYQELITISNNAADLDLGDDILDCSGTSSITLDAGISGMATYLWDYQGSNIGTTQSITISQSGTYSLSVLDACGNVNFDEIVVILNNDCVWPGDFNYDNVVNNHDLLSFGLAFGQTGPKRPRSRLSWTPQACMDWAGGDPVNYKHIDGNGDGVIDLNDPQAIIINYGKTHDTIMPLNNEETPFVLTAVPATSPTSFSNNTQLYVDLYLHLDTSQTTGYGVDTSQITAYGLALDLIYVLPPEVLKLNSITLDFSQSWLGVAGFDMQTLVEHIPSQNKVEIALTRLDRQNAHGNTPFGVAIFDVDVLTTVDMLQNVVLAMDRAKLSISGGGIIDVGANGGFISVGGSTQSLDFVANPPAVVELKAVLEGVYDTNSNQMTTNLINNSPILLPNNQPYNIAPWNYKGTENLNTSQFPNNTVDWLLVEARKASNMQQIVEQKAVLLLDNGEMISVDRVTAGLGAGITFNNLKNSENYYFVVRHRNHLAVVSSVAIPLINNTLSYDFSSNINQAMNNEQLTEVATNTYALYAGDFDSNGVINVLDFNYFEKQQETISTYNDADIDLNGSVLTSDFNKYLPNASRFAVPVVRY